MGLLGRDDDHHGHGHGDIQAQDYLDVDVIYHDLPYSVGFLMLSLTLCESCANLLQGLVWLQGHHNDDVDNHYHHHVHHHHIHIHNYHTHHDQHDMPDPRPMVGMRR